MNAYGMRFSFVWDHWVYLSALGIIALVMAVVMRTAEGLRTPGVVYGFGAIILLLLALLTWRQAGMYTDMETLWRTTLARNPDCWMAPNNLGAALTAKGRFDEAIENYRRAIQINSNRPETFSHMGMTLGQLGRKREAIAQYREALRLNPNLAMALNNLEWLLATSPDDEFRNGAEAVRLAERACELTHYDEPLFIGTLAAAYAESGRFSEAVTTAEKAEQLATSAGLAAVAAKNRQLLELYRAGKPCHEPGPTGH